VATCAPALLQAFGCSTAGARPWLVDNQFQALQNSGNVRLVRRLQPDLNLAGLYGGPAVLFSQIDRIQGTYPEVAPAMVDDDDLARAIEAIRVRRIELTGLARNEAAVATAKERKPRRVAAPGRRRRTRRPRRLGSRRKVAHRSSHPSQRSTK